MFHATSQSLGVSFVTEGDPLRRRVLAQAVDIICDPDSGSVARDLAKTQWSMGRLRSTDRRAQQKLAEEVLGMFLVSLIVMQQVNVNRCPLT